PLLRALLAHDLIGFQTAHDTHHFLECVDRLMPAATVSVRGQLSTIEVGGRCIWVGTFPIGIDADELAERAGAPAGRRRVRALTRTLGGQQVLLGVERLDYTKGLLERLAAFERLLEQWPELRERVLFLQIVVPSRESVPAYKELKSEVDCAIGRIN